MLTRNKYLLCTFLVCFGASTVWAQTSITEFQKVLAEKASFQETDFAALQANQPVVRLAPVSDKREIAVAGLVNIRRRRRRVSAVVSRQHVAEKQRGHSRNR